MRSEAFILIRLVVQANRSNDRAQKVLIMRAFARDAIDL